MTAVFIYSSYYKYWTNLYGLPVAGWNEPESGTKLNIKGLAKSVTFVICSQQLECIMKLSGMFHLRQFHDPSLLTKEKPFPVREHPVGNFGPRSKTI